MFSFSDNWERDLDRWKWDSGTIVTSNQHGAKLETVDEEGQARIVMAPARMVAFGVRFLREDIERIARPAATDGGEQSGATARKPPSRGKSGPRPKKYYAGTIRARLGAEIASGDIYKRFSSVSQWGVQAALEREIAEEFDADDCPSESTIRRWVKELMTAWREIEKVR